MNKKILLMSVSTYLLMIGIFIPPASLASVILDQETTADDISAFAVARDRTQFQTVTAGLTGILANIEVYVRKSSSTFEDLVLGIWSTDSSSMPLSELASFSKSSYFVPTQAGFVSFNVSSANLSLSAGDMFAISLDSEASNDIPWTERYLWSHARSDQPDYLGGQSFTCTVSCLLNLEDNGFRTYVQTIPIPPALWLFGSGILGLVGISRRKKAA